MAKEQPIANLSQQLEKIKQAFNEYKSVSESLNSSVGNTAGTGMSKVSKSVWKTMTDYFNKFPELFFGKSSTKKGTKASKPMDYGIAYLSALLASLDLCSLMKTLSNLSNSMSGKFDSHQDPPPNDQKYKIQKVAYSIQVSIDVFEAAYATTKNPSTAILGLLSEISPNLTKLGSSNYLGSPEIRDQYPQVDKFNTIVQETLSKFSNVSTVSNGDKATINSLLKSITLLRQICVLIQGLTSPASLVTFAQSALPPSTFQAIDKLGVDKIDPKDISKTIAEIEFVTLQIDQALKVVVNYIRVIQQLIRICLILVKVFKVIINFLKVLPLPNMYTTSGVTTTFADTVNKLDQYCKNTIKLLNEVNLFVSMIVGFIQGTTAAIDQITLNLETVLKNLKSCQRGDGLDQTVAGLENNLSNIKQSNQEMKDFVQNLEAKKSNTKNTYYGYTIQILTEEVTDKQVLKYTIPRRYGIAVNSANIEVVRTDYTFASNDEVIRNQVKLLLQEKHLISQTAGALTSQETDIVNQSINALQDNDITMDDIPNDSPTAQIDDPNNENDNSGLGMNSFFNKQKGGKKMRNKVKQIMNQSKQKLGSNLQNVKK